MDKLCHDGCMKSDQVSITFLNHYRLTLKCICFHPFRPRQFQEDNATVNDSNHLKQNGQTCDICRDSSKTVEIVLLV